MYFNTALGHYSMHVHHLINTHIIAEVFLGHAYNTLSESHPIYKMLAPHFEGLTATNDDLIFQIKKENGSLHTTSNFGFSGDVQLNVAAYSDWHFNKSDFLFDLKVC